LYTSRHGDQVPEHVKKKHLTELNRIGGNKNDTKKLTLLAGRYLVAAE